MVAFNHWFIRKEENIHQSILFGFPESSDNAIVINYCILYAKQYIYLEKLNDQKNQCRLLELHVPPQKYTKDRKKYMY